MPETAFRRHDLVWLDPAWPLSAFALQSSAADAKRWITRGLPFVVARQDPALPGLRIGFTLPGTGVRQRVGLQVPREAVIRHEAAPPLAQMLAHAPAHWRDGLARLLDDFSGSWLVPRVFGSLVTEAFSGEACLRPESDLDLLLACSGRADVEAALAILRRHDDQAPRVDAELRMPQGEAVAWRELERALAGNDGRAQVLVKSETGVRMIAAHDFAGCSA